MKVTTFKFSGFVFMVLTVFLCSVLGGPPDARADFVLAGGTIENSFADLEAQGFGNSPRLLTLQEGGNPNIPMDEGGKVVLNSSGVPSSAAFTFNNNVGTQVTLNNVVNPGPNSDKNSAPSLGTLGWTSGANVKIGFNTDQANSGIILDQMILSLYNNNNVVIDTFSLDPSLIPLTFTAAQLDLQHGNGNAVFEFVLNAAEQAEFNADLLTALPGSSSTFHVALAAGASGAVDGPDSWIAVIGPTSPLLQTPEPATMLLLGSGLIGLAGYARKRFKK